MSNEAYARDQEKLRQKQGGGTGGDEEADDLHIDVPQGLPEVNPEVFRDVEPLLFKGFVYAPAVINDVTFVFKSLNHHEFEQLGFMDQRNVTHKTLKKHFDRFLAFGVAFMDGINILPDRDKWLAEIAEMFGGLNESVRRKVIYNLSEINRRASRAVLLSEAYTMEAQSRLRWAQYKGTDLMSPSVTGFAGTATLGMNWGQLVWRALNFFEDRREDSEREWENAKFVASSMAGKGMSKVYSQDKQRRKREREEKLERRDKILRFALLNESPLGDSKGTTQMAVARSVEELASQLEHDLKGEKDWHDMVVEQYEQQAKKQHHTRVQVIRERYAAHQDEYGNRQVVGGIDPKAKGLTPDEVRFRIERKRQLQAQQLAAQASVPELHDPKMAQFLEKWTSAARPEPEEGSTQVGPLTIAERPKGIPFKRGDR